MDRRVFVSIHSKRLANLISEAGHRVVYAAPGISEPVADAIDDARQRLGKYNVDVILDIDSDVCRLGYGKWKAVERIRNAGMEIRQATGLRIGVLLCDDRGWLWSPTPELIEPEGHEDETPNGLVIEQVQATRLLDAMCPEPESNLLDEVHDESDSREHNGDAQKPQSELIDTRKHLDAEIGVDTAQIEQFQKVSEDLRQNPPLAFDLARKVRVFNAFVEFAKLSFKGGNLGQHKVSLPASITRIVKDKNMQQRIRTSFSLLEDKSKSAEEAKQINKRVAEIRNEFFKSIGPKYERVILRAKKDTIEKKVHELRRDIEKFENKIRERIGLELAKSRKKLLKELTPRILESPPNELLNQIERSRPTKKQTESFLDQLFEKVFPSTDQLIERMHLDLQYMGVTYETLQSGHFQDAVRKAFPLIDWGKPFREFDASEGTNPDNLIGPIGKN